MLGDALRRTRLEQGRTLADVAKDARVSMPYLSEIERGRKEASSEILAAICGALRIELCDVLAMVGDGLAGGRARAAEVIRLDTARAFRAPYPGRAPGSGRGPGDGEAKALLAA